MEMQDRITYDAEMLILELEQGLDRLKTFQFDGRYRQLLGEDFVRKLSGWDQAIRTRKNDPFTLVVCGEFKRGKSSLINALLGEDVVTTNVTTETVTLNRISYGPHSNEALLSGGRKMQLSDEELERDRLEPLLYQTGETVRQLEIHRPLELLKHITIIDTPGMGDAMKDFSELVEQAMSQADAVIYVFSVNYPLSQREQLFLKTEVLPQRYTDLFLVGNYADVLSSQSDYDRMLKLLRERIQGLLSGQEPWMLSALDQRCLQQGEERPNRHMAEVLEDNFSRFREKLTLLIEEKKNMVLPDRMQRLTRGMLEDLSDNLTAMEEGLRMSSQDAQEKMVRLKEQCKREAEQQTTTARKIEHIVNEMQAEAYEWIGNLLDRLQAEVDTLADRPAEELTKYYSFYCIDTLQEAINRCAEYHTLELYDALEDISFDLTKSLSGEQEQKTYSFRFSLDNRTWTKGDNISYVISKVGLGPIGLIADGITGALRQKELASKTPDILQKIKLQYGSLRVSALKAVEDIYTKMADKVKKQMSEHYGEKLQEAQKQAEQSARMARQDDEKKAEVQEVLKELRLALAELEGVVSRTASKEERYEM